MVRNYKPKKSHPPKNFSKGFLYPALSSIAATGLNYLSSPIQKAYPWAAPFIKPLIDAGTNHAATNYLDFGRNYKDKMRRKYDESTRKKKMAALPAWKKMYKKNVKSWKSFINENKPALTNIWLGA